MRELHAELSNGLRSINRKQGGEHGNEGGEHERGRLPPGRHEGDKHPWRNCPDKPGSNSHHDLLSPRPLQIHAKTGMLEEEEDSGAYLSGMSDEQDADDELAGRSSDEFFSEESDDDDGGTPGKMVEFMVPEWLASTENTKSAAQVQQGVPQREGGPEKTARARPTGEQGAGRQHEKSGGLGWNPNQKRI